MADDNTLRSYRSNNSYRRSANPAEAQDQAPGGDPLAELARLIGQTDPYIESGRRQSPGAAPRPAQQAQHVQDDPDGWRRHRERPSYETRSEPAFDTDSRYAPADHRADHDPYRMPSAHNQAHYAEPHQDDRHDRAYDQAYAGETEYPDERMYADAQHRGEYAGGHYADQYGTDQYGTDQYDTDPYGADRHAGGMRARSDDYDDPPRRKRGSNLVTAVVLIGCAMLGTAGAYGYRTYTASSDTTPPVIIADNSPSKIVPEKSSRSQDRAAQPGGERLVSREEQPVTLQQPGSTVPRVVFPSPAQSGPTTTGTTSAPAPTNSESSDESTEQPKRVRTVTIRPDGGDASAQPSGDASRAPPAPRGSRDEPLSLNPAAQANEASRPQQRAAAPRENQRTAALPPSNSGGYVVQVSSQRSEADAQASYRGLQAKYSLLRSRQPIIRRADLGSRGIYYRAMVGPFESADEAGQFCNGLKQAGGQCLIMRN